MATCFFVMYLEPYDIDKINSAFKKYENINKKTELKIDVLKHLKKAYTKEYKTRFATQLGAKVFTFSVDQVSYFIFEDGLVVLVTNEEKKFALPQSLDAIETLINPNKFFRINRKMIINYESIINIKIQHNGHIELSINAYSSKPSILVSRRRTHSFKLWLDQ